MADSNIWKKINYDYDNGLASTTTAMNIHRGIILRVTSYHSPTNINSNVSESLTFVPGVKVEIDRENGGYKIVTD